jgi:LuxR family maltose regulon positive regulatory protein
MCGPLCEAVLGLPGSAAALAGLAGSNLLLVPLDRHKEWYRYHHLFRDVLLAELRRQEPGLIPVLRRRAAAWCQDNGLPEEALEYFMAAGDVEAAAVLAEKFWIPLYRQGRVATIQRLLEWLEERGGIEGHPVLAVMASLIFALTGRPAEADRWADVADRWPYGDAARPAGPFAESLAALVRAISCRHGVGPMRADADEAAEKAAAQQVVSPAPALMRGLACVLAGDREGGDAWFEDAVSAGEKADAPETLAVTLCERSLVAVTRGDWDRAQALADRAGAVLRRAGIEDSYATPLVCAVRARLAVHRGDAAAARQELVSAQRLRGLLTYAFPVLAVQVRLELAHVHLALADIAGARTLLREIDDLFRRRPGLGTLAGEADALRAQLARQRGPIAAGASSLTAAELRLLPLLATHLQFGEIAADMVLSRHTIKAQAKSIYRKLGVYSRSQAVERSRELGLLEG